MLRITDETRPMGLVVSCEALQKHHTMQGCADHQHLNCSGDPVSSPAQMPLTCQGTSYACQYTSHASAGNCQCTLHVQVCRGTAVMMVSPTAGTEELAQNPFKPDDE